MFVCSTLGNSSELYLKHTSPEIIRSCMCVPELRGGGVAYFNLIFLKSFIKFVTIKKKSLIRDPEDRGRGRLSY